MFAKANHGIVRVGQETLETVKFTRLLQIITPHRSTLLLVVVILLANSLAALAQPWIAGKLTSAILAPTGIDPTIIQVILLGWLGLILVKGFLEFSSGYLIGSTGAQMSARLRRRVYEHMQVLPIGYFHQRRAGESLSLLSTDAGIISNFVTTTLVSLLPLLLTFFGAFFMMARLDGQLALLAGLLLPIYFLAMKLIGRKIRPVSRDWVQSWSRLISFVEENLGMLPVIKSFNREPLESRRFESHNADLLNLTRRQILLQSIMGPLVGLLASAGLLLLLWLGIRHITTSELDTANLVSLLLYAMLMIRPISGLANVYGQVQSTRGAAERLVGFFAEQAEPGETDLPPLANIGGDIRFEQLTFAYPERNAVFNDFNLEIKAGETIALTGPNGAGKSTLVHLLMRFIEPQSGRILIDDQDIQNHSLESIRSAIGLVAQTTLLLNGSVSENIAYGQFDATQADIENAAKSAGAHDFITQLPNGYDTTIGDQGVRLSGGQRQKVSLARTLLKKPPILVFDEATAMLDPQGESSFIAECNELLRQRTVILITHRPASLALADRIVTLGNTG